MDIWVFVCIYLSIYIYLYRGVDPNFAVWLFVACGVRAELGLVG